MNKAFRLVIGFVFLVSSLLKAIDTANFANLMSQYGIPWFGYFAPFLILLETILALLLIYNVCPRIASVITMVFLVAVSLIFLYGWIHRGIRNCGCFGAITWLNSKPWFTFVRNGILLAMLFPSILKQQYGTTMTMPIIVCMAIWGILVMFMCGFSFCGAECLKKQQEFQPIALADSNLSELVSCNTDSTYMIFAFSYSCPYCQNSIGNVNQYQTMGAVDKVIGIAVGDSIAKERFNSIFDVNFEIREISQSAMFRLTPGIPTVYHIRHDSIVGQYSGMVVSPSLLPESENFRKK